jgi:hypothetical protein
MEITKWSVSRQADTMGNSENLTTEPRGHIKYRNA